MANSASAFKNIFFICIDWIFARVFPQRNEIVLEKPSPETKIVFCFNRRSIVDQWIIWKFCKKLDLIKGPLTHIDLQESKKGPTIGFFALQSYSLWGQGNNRTTVQEQLLDLFRYQQGISQTIKVYPVSIFWGFAAGSKNPLSPSQFLVDDDQAGVLRRFFIVLANRKQVLVNIDRPIDLAAQLHQFKDLSMEKMATKIRRVLKVHFMRTERFFKGPRTATWEEVRAHIFRSPKVTRLMAEHAAKSGLTRKDVHLKVERMLRGMANKQNYFFMLFFKIFLKFIWKRIYNGFETYGREQLYKASKNSTVVYVSTHKSHLDYLVFPFQIFEIGLSQPLFAAGDNLSVFPLGVFLRRGVAFFIRRKFSDDRLYTAVFSEYLSFLVNRNYSIAFFPEGGRSRTGKLLIPKTGLLSMLVQIFKDTHSNITFVPVYITYDKIAEVNTYIKEIKGKKKEKESLKTVFNARKILKQNHGKAYIRFGHLLDLESFADGRKMDPSDVQDLAADLMKRIHQNVLVTPTSMTSFCLSTNPQRSMTETDLVHTLNLSYELIEYCYKNQGVMILDRNPRSSIKRSCEILPIQQFDEDQIDANPVYFYDDRNSKSLLYYKNSVLHLFSIPSLVCLTILQNRSCSLETLKTTFELYSEFANSEYFLSLESQEKTAHLMKILQFLTHHRLVEKIEESSDAAYYKPVDENKVYFVTLALADLSTILSFFYILSELNRHGGLKEGWMIPFKEKILSMCQNEFGIEILDLDDRFLSRLVQFFIQKEWAVRSEETFVVTRTPKLEELKDIPGYFNFAE